MDQCLDEIQAYWACFVVPCIFCLIYSYCGCCSEVTKHVMEAASCISAARSRVLSTVNCLVLQKLALAVVQLTDIEYQRLVSSTTGYIGCPLVMEIHGI